VGRPETGVLAPLDLVPKLVEHPLERDFGGVRRRACDGRAVTKSKAHRAPEASGDARIALLGEVHVGA
jgi:hypothetical protein